MEIASVKVDAVTARVESCKPIPRGLVGGTVKLSYADPIWEKLNKTVVFRGAVTKDVVSVSDSVEIPWETLERVGKTLYIGFYGRDTAGSIVVPTVWASLGTIESAADPSGDASAEPSPEVWEQLQAMIGSLSDLETEDKDTVVAAINEALAKGGVDEAEVKTVVLDCLEAVGTGADIYVLADGETLADAPEKAEVVIDPSGAQSVCADWEAAEGEEGHILNRPFGDEEVCILPETKLVFEYSQDIGAPVAYAEPEQMPTVGYSYTICFNGTAYSCVCVAMDPDTMYLGNMGMAGGEDTGEPFIAAISISAGAMLIMPLTADPSAEMSIRGLRAVPIATEYAPEAVVLDLVELGIPEVKESEVVSVPFDDMVALNLALRKGAIRLRARLSFSYSNVFSSDIESTESNICEMNASIRKVSDGFYHIRALLEDCILFIKITGGKLEAIIRRIALA